MRRKQVQNEQGTVFWCEDVELSQKGALDIMPDRMKETTGSALTRNIVLGASKSGGRRSRLRT